LGGRRDRDLQNLVQRSRLALRTEGFEQGLSGPAGIERPSFDDESQDPIVADDGDSGYAEPRECRRCRRLQPRLAVCSR
jgi:hypothetical protein